jgi:iron complex outermembrane receptor protein
MRNTLLLSVATAALLIPGAALAQTTGSADIDSQDIVVKGSRNTSVAGVQIPDTPKTRQVLTQEFIKKQVPGQSIDEIINQMPGVSFQNNDPYGSSGGRLTIRGFGPDRISQTIDGIPVNDTGNYSLYSNQQIAPELIDQVNVTLGSTDIDSPTASASGSTVAYRTIVPTDDFHARVLGSIGDFNYFRVFGIVNTGTFTPWGTKAWFSANTSTNDVIFSNFGKVKKDAYDAKIYQPIGSNGDFISIAGNYNVNRNQNTPDFRLYNVRSAPVNGTSSGRIPTNLDEAFAFSSPRCTTATANAGVTDAPNTCGTLYEQNVNPSNTGSVRINSRFTLADGLVLTVDPNFQYTKANGGSYGAVGREQVGPGGYLGYVAGNYYYGRDLNGDGDTRDTVELDQTSQTVTHRWTINSSLRYDITPSQTIRVAYSHDYGRHRQSGEGINLLLNGQPQDVFPLNSPLLASNGIPVEKRNRISYAVLDQASAEYRGKFFDDALSLTAGVRVPWFKRNLKNYCFTTSVSGGVSCIAGDAATVAAYGATVPYNFTQNAAGNAVPTGAAPPQFRQFTYNKALPSAGFQYKFSGGFQVYGSYSKGLQVPGTDNLYQSFYYPVGVQSPVPEVTDNFDAGIRYTTSKIQAQVGPWYSLFTNRLASSYDPFLDQTTYRNLGKVKKYGVDGSISYQPLPQLSLYAFGSYLKSEIEDNVLGGACSATNVRYGTFGCNTLNADYFLATKGKREAGAPTYTFGGRAEVDVAPFSVGVQAKRTGPRYINDQNLPLYYNATSTAAALDITNPATTQVYGAKAPAYTVVDLDARVSLGWAGLNDKTYFQLNITNLFNQYYIGNLGSTSSAYNTIPYVYLGSPRAISGSLNVEF